MRKDILTSLLKPLPFIIGAATLFTLALAKENAPVASASKERLREGTRLLDAPGRFEAIGDRVNFIIAESGQSVGILENLALDRVFRVLREKPSAMQWSVSGTITEYSETNYLLLTKAVQAGKSTPQDSTKPSGIGTRPQVDYSVPPGKVPAEKVPAEKHAEKKPEPTHDKHP